MKPYISQPEGSMSCGAYSISYYLWETKKSQSINDYSFVDSIYENIKIGTNSIGINAEYSDPDKMIDELNNKWSANASYCILESSPLAPLLTSRGAGASGVDVFYKLKEGNCKYAIIICSLTEFPSALHYILIKYEENSFKMLDSLTIITNKSNDVHWQEFNIGSNSNLIVREKSPYIFTQAGIIMD